MRLDDKIGSFKNGAEADFIVLDYQATPLIERRLQLCQNLAERLFALMILGDDRTIAATWIMGKKLYERGAMGNSEQVKTPKSPLFIGGKSEA